MAMELNFESIVSMVENMITGICIFELKNGKITPVYLNEGLSRMLGYSMTETQKAFKNVRNSIIPEDLPILEQAIIDVLKDDGAVDFELRTVTLSGGMRWLQVRANLYSREKDVYTVCAVLVDATERKNVEEEMRQQAEKLHIVAAAEGEMIFDYNAKTDVMTIRHTEDIFNRNEIILNNYFGKYEMGFIHDDDAEYFFAVFRSALKSPKHDTMELRSRRYEGEYQWYQCSVTSMAGVEGYVTRVIGRLVNINERKLKEMDLKVRAEKDALTGMYNQGATEQLIKKYLDESVEELQSDINGLHAFIMIDLDNFKEVNDILGHAQGDKVLSETAMTILTNFKGSDIPGRVGGDEFAVFVRDIESISQADMLAAKLCEELRKSVPSAYGEIIISASIGISIFPYHGTTYEELFAKADKALYTAKANGKDGYRIFDAAATIAYHSNRRNNQLSLNYVETPAKKLEDLVSEVLFDDKIKESSLASVLELISSEYGMQRAFICDSDNDRTIRFIAEGYEIGSDENRMWREEFCESLSRSHKRFCIIHQYDDLEDEERSFMVEEGIRSLMYYPIYHEGEYKGAIIFQNHTEDEIILTEEQQNELRCLLRIINAYVLQDGFISRVPNAVAQIQMMDNMDNYVYVVDADTYQINFVNRKVALASKSVQIGEYCYKLLSNSNEPCENCVMKNLDRANPHARESEERFNYALRTWTKNSACWLECNEASATCMMSCVDISDYLA